MLERIAGGDRQAAEQLMPLVYDELRRLAARKMAAEKPGHTLQATALVHDAYLRLFGAENPESFQNRGSFFAAAAQAMRRILIDSARRKGAQKRGGGYERQDLDVVWEPPPDDRMLALDEALEKLAAIDPRKAELVELRYFGGLTSEQAAAVLGISPTTADRDWAFARAWLKAEMSGG